MHSLMTKLKSVPRLMMAGAVALATVVAAPMPAHAQGGAGAGMAEIGMRDYLHRDMVIVAQAFELDDNQRLILDNLFEDYVAEFESSWEQSQQSFNELVQRDLQSNPQDAMRMVADHFESWIHKKAQMKQRFETSIRSILNEEQAQRWPSFERQILREKSLHHGRLSGESVNLFHVVRDMRLDERTQVHLEPVMQEYAVALHEALRRRQTAMREAQGDFLTMLRSPGQDLADQTRAEIALISHNIAVRDVNDQYRERIAASLPHELGRQMRAAALDRGYARIYRVLPAMRAYRQAMELEDLDEDTLASVRDMHMIFEAELDVLNSRLLAQLRDFEPKQLRNHAEIRQARLQGERVERLPDPMREGLRQRDERAEYYLSMLRELLGEETFALLPAARRTAQVENREAAAAARQRIRQQREAMQQMGDESGARRPAGTRGDTPPRRDNGGDDR
jgi:hypothetical protein